jgi:hypothetical protein
MKNTITLTLALMVSVAGFSQNWAVFSWLTDEHGEEFSFDVLNHITGDTIYHGENYADNQMYWLSLNFPNGQFRVDLHDSGCDGFSGGGMMSMVYMETGLWHIIGDYGCNDSRVTTYEWYDPCALSACDADFNGNGTVDVLDLIYFISTYGITCE